MFRKLFIVSIFLASSLAFAKLQSITADELVAMQKKGIPVIDIRTPQEWNERGVIPNAHLMMFFDKNGKPHVDEWMQKLSQLIKTKDDPFIIYCAHANRTKALGNWLSDKVGFKNVYELKGGIEYGWIDKGKKVKKLAK